MKGTVSFSGDLRGVTGGDGELGCLCGKAGTSHLCDGSAHSSGCVVNGSNYIWVFLNFAQAPDEGNYKLTGIYSGCV